MPLVRQVPVRCENLPHDFALQTVRKSSARLRQKAGNLLVERQTTPVSNAPFRR